MLFILPGFAYKDKTRNYSSARTFMLLQVFQLWGTWLFWHRLCWRHLIMFYYGDSTFSSRSFTWVDCKLSCIMEPLRRDLGRPGLSCLRQSLPSKTPVWAETGVGTQSPLFTTNLFIAEKYKEEHTWIPHHRDKKGTNSYNCIDKNIKSTTNSPFKTTQINSFNRF